MRKVSVTYNAPATLTFVIACFIVTILGVQTDGALTQNYFMTYYTSMSDPMMYLRLFTHVFGHNGWEHYMANAAYILLLGPILEEKHGSDVIVEIIIATSLVTGVVNNFYFKDVALCGASGIVFAFILLASLTSFKRGEVPLTFILIAIIYIGQQIVDGIFISDNISNMAHIVGGIVGTVVGYLLNRDTVDAD